MSEKRQNPELELEAVEDDDLQDVAGGQNILPDDDPRKDDGGKPGILGKLSRRSGRQADDSALDVKR